jgi:DNA (cytosine-5)-methyltransferase 1
MNDARNRLVLEFVRLVSELDADAFVFENVKGLTVGKHKRFLDELIAEFETRGYVARVPIQVLNAACYGVPQSRERLILLGAKRGKRLPLYPNPTTSPAGAIASDLPRGPTCLEALGDLPDAEYFEDLNERDEVFVQKWGRASAYAAELRCLTNSAWHSGYRRSWNPRVLTSSARTVHSAISRRRFAETKPGSVEPISRFYKLEANGVSNTLRAGTDAARGAFTSPRPIHYALPRCITVREMARLHGFPDWFRFHTTKWHGARQIGNAVPPPLARAVATEVLKACGLAGQGPEAAISLGDPSLLTMDMGQAVAHFGIEPPIGRRDRKSGAKKRKQHQIEAERALVGIANG